MHSFQELCLVNLPKCHACVLCCAFQQPLQQPLQGLPNDHQTATSGTGVRQEDYSSDAKCVHNAQPSLLPLLQVPPASGLCARLLPLFANSCSI